MRNKYTQKVFRHVSGWFCIIAGLVMLITPGQGVITILIGIYLLADDIPFFAHLRDRIEKRFPKTANYVQRKQMALKEKIKNLKE